MDMTIGTLGHAVAAVAFLGLTVVLVASRQGGRHDALLVAASGLTSVWALGGLVSEGERVPLERLGSGLGESARILAWGLFVDALILVGRRPLSDPAANEAFHSAFDGWRYPLFALAILVLQLILATVSAHALLSPEHVLTVLAVLLILATLSALALLGNLYRNTPPERRHAVRHLCLALGAMLAFDVLTFTDTLLFDRVSATLRDARGIVYACLVPLLALSVARSGGHEYDCRREWFEFTRTLARDPSEAPRTILEGLLTIVESETGALWVKGRDGHDLLARRGLAGLEQVPPAMLRSLERFLESSGRLVDLDEWRARPERYPELELPDVIAEDTTLRLVVPLPFRDAIVGMALLGRSHLAKRIDREDRDLLKAAGHQAGGILAQTAPT